MKIHPFAKLWPPYTDREFKDLVADIKKKGLLDPIETLGGQILDGYNRFKACEVAGVKPRFKEYTGDDALGYVTSKNTIRRHLPPIKLGEIALRILEMEKVKGNFSATQRGTARKMGISRSSIQRAARKRREASGEADGPKVWSVDEVKADKDLFEAFKAISELYGNADTKAIRLGAYNFKHNDVLFLGKMCRDNPAKAREMQDLIVAMHWAPKKALEFLGECPTEDSTLEDLAAYCLATKGKFYEADINGYHYTVKLNQAVKR